MMTQKELERFIEELIQNTDHQRIKLGHKWATLSDAFEDYLSEIGGLSASEIDQVLSEITNR